MLRLFPVSGTYRIYHIDRANHVVEVELLNAATDEEAIGLTRAMKRAGKHEVWIGERLIATVHTTGLDEPSEAYWL